jgi:hypothetical protein
MGKDKGGAAVKGDGGSRGIGSFGSHLLTIGCVLFVVAWFMNVLHTSQGVQLLDNLGAVRGIATWPSGTSGSDVPWLPGWTACRFAWTILFSEVEPGADAWKIRMLGATCLTNGLMVLTVLGALVRARSGLLGFLLIGCAWVNASWIWLQDSNPMDWAGPGYWAWLASFVFAGLGSMLARKRRG